MWSEIYPDIANFCYIHLVHPVDWRRLCVLYNGVRLCCASEPSPSENFLPYSEPLFQGYFHISDIVLYGGHDSLLGTFYNDPPFLRELPGIHFWCTVTHLHPLEVHPCLVGSVKAALVNPLVKFYSRMLWARGGGADFLLQCIFGYMRVPNNYIIHSGFQYWPVSILVFLLLWGAIVGARRW